MTLILLLYLNILFGISEHLLTLLKWPDFVGASALRTEAQGHSLCDVFLFCYVTLTL